MRIWAFLIYQIVLVGAINGLTPISGDIDNIVFDISKNPYIVENDIIVPAGKTIKIPEGIVFLFQPFTGFQILGQLEVNGAGDKPVVFTSINDNIFNSGSELLPNPFDWNGIYISKDAVGTFLNNIAVKFSVYGIKSQSQNIIIQNAIFQQNGQFHFTVNEQIQMVQDNIPYSFGGKQTVSDKKEPAKPVNNNKKNNKAKVFRFTSLGIGLASGVTAAIFKIKSDQYYDKLVGIKENKNSGHDLYEKKLKMCDTGAIVSGVAGGLGLIGFGISFAF